MSPLEEYLHENAESFQPDLAVVADGESIPHCDTPQPDNDGRILEVLRDRRKTLQDLVTQYESIYESSPVIHNATAPTCFKTLPAASAEAIARLPKARVLPWDRETEKDCTKTCGVCCDRLVDGVLLTRLPCGHVYHVYCVVPWLSKNCTCPECRYEIETNNPHFEAGRKQRMKDRAVVTCSCKGTHTCFFPSKDSEYIVWEL
jgi:hypothetical protein